MYFLETVDILNKKTSNKLHFVNKRTEYEHNYKSKKTPVLKTQIVITEIRNTNDCGKTLLLTYFIVGVDNN